MNVYNGILKFNGTFRTYQQRVLDKADSYLRDGKIHIVAAPGSGKTTLGIELIRRIGEPALVISPRLVIRDQWIERMKSAFLINDRKDILSRDLKHPALITSITYQTLFSAMTKYKGTEEDAAEEELEKQKEEVDFSGFDLLKTVKAAGIKVICLDECHHLRSEWWKTLEEFTAQLKKSGLKVIALTATPPYDSNKTEWERYTNMCGAVDEEIIVPELVKDKCLCPHQDYVMFSFPTEEEKQKLDEYSETLSKVFEQFMQDQIFAEGIGSHIGVADYNANSDQMMEYPAYLSSILIFLSEKGIRFDKRWQQLLDVKTFPKMDPEWMQILLQGFLFDDTASYNCTEEYRENLIKELKRRHLIVRKKVVLVENDQVKKMMVSSLGKLDSMIMIAKSEYASMGKELRMLILTDFIRKEYKAAIGYPEKDVQEMGVLPIFENLRRQMPAECRLAVLCGSVVILPDTAIEALCQAVKVKFGKDNLVTSKKVLGEGSTETGYSEVAIVGKNSEIISLVTEIFEKGYFEVMIGTKSLLGEGYDSPCVNSLILASFVGSFVLSNQMRGRAIRMQKGNADKTANIWHLVCVENAEEKNILQTIGKEKVPQSADFETLKRRMKGFLGVSYDGTRIENGVERLDIIKEPFTPESIEAMNSEMLRMAGDRALLRNQWETAVTNYDGMEVVDEFETESSALMEKAFIDDVMGDLIRKAILAGFVIVFMLVKFKFSIPTLILSAILAIVVVKTYQKLQRRKNPSQYLKEIGNGILKNLKNIGEITTKCCVETERSESGLVMYLSGGTAREKEVFAQCVEEFFGIVDNQRYLLCKKGANKYFCVPQLFAKRKEDAERFAKNLEDAIGKYELIYTRNPEGRKVLLHARTFANANLAKNMQDGFPNVRKKKLN